MANVKRDRLRAKKIYNIWLGHCYDRDWLSYISDDDWLDQHIAASNLEYHILGRTYKYLSLPKDAVSLNG